MHTLTLKPYPEPESRGNPMKMQFNTALVGLRKRISECIYGQWKRRFPYVKHMRVDFVKAQKIVVSNLCLQNLAKKWGEPDIEADNEEVDDNPDQNPLPEVENDAVLRNLGRIKRDEMVNRRYTMHDHI